MSAAPRALLVLLRGGVAISTTAAVVFGGVLGGTTAAADSTVPLNGLFALAPGVCSGGVVTGSFFRMILPTGDAGGPYLSNSDSSCSDQTVTPLEPGSDGGLVSGSYQAQPAQAFDGAGNAVSGRVTQPTRFYGVGFATATNEVDPQTGGGTAVPQIFSTNGALSGDLSALGVTWNNQVFNQGAPKPGGGLPGKTSALSGSIDQAGNFVVEWTSQIVGGPFNNFTGLWHLAGQYRGGNPVAAPAAPPAPAAPAPAPGQVPAAGPAPAPAPAAVPAPAEQPAAAPVPEAAPAAAPQPATVAEPALTSKTIDLPNGDKHPRWLVPVLLGVGLLGVAAFFNADRLVRRRKS